MTTARMSCPPSPQLRTDDERLTIIRIAIRVLNQIRTDLDRMQGRPAWYPRQTEVVHVGVLRCCAPMIKHVDNCQWRERL